MRTCRAAALLFAFALTASASAASAGAGAWTHQASAEGQDRAREELVFTEKITNAVDLDLGEQGLGLGDRFTYTSEILDQEGKRVGSGGGECIVLTIRDGKSAVNNCVGGNHLPDGQITFQGFWDFTGGTGTVAVTGGTGRYAGARGTLSGEATSEDSYTERISLTW